MFSKILFIGPMGAGKSTAIAQISQIDPVSTEVENTDREQFDKATTTVALDYGEIALNEELSLMLYGIPGQDRFDFVWPVLAQGALGAILLLNNESPDAIQEMHEFLEAFPDLTQKHAVVIGVGRVSADHPMQDYRRALMERNLPLPVFTTDARDRQQVLLLLETLVATAEINQYLDGT